MTRVPEVPGASHGIHQEHTADRRRADAMTAPGPRRRRSAFFPYLLTGRILKGEQRDHGIAQSAVQRQSPAVPFAYFHGAHALRRRRRRSIRRNRDGNLRREKECGEHQSWLAGSTGRTVHFKTVAEIIRVTSISPMSEDPQGFENTPALSATAAAEWTGCVENVLRGVAHGLNNRAAALSALVELSSEPAEAPAVLREILTTEQQRIRDLVQVLRIIGTARAAAEALMPADVARDVSLVLDHHPDLRDGAIQMEASQASPIRAPRWAFVRSLMALAAGLAGVTRLAPGRITMLTDGDWLVVSAADHSPPLPTLASELARHMGGEPLASGYGIRLPTLAALRRREGR